MAINDRDRRILWGRSGARCAMCRCLLVIDAKGDDRESVVGEECHIVAQSEAGPRGVVVHRPEDIDGYSNLILLCAVHHKMVDDQPTTHTVQSLQALKSHHEAWVRVSLDAKQQPQEVLTPAEELALQVVSNTYRRAFSREFHSRFLHDNAYSEALKSIRDCRIQMHKLAGRFYALCPNDAPTFVTLLRTAEFIETTLTSRRSRNRFLGTTGRLLTLDLEIARIEFLIASHDLAERHALSMPPVPMSSVHDSMPASVTREALEVDLARNKAEREEVASKPGAKRR